MRAGEGHRLAEQHRAVDLRRSESTMGREHRGRKDGRGELRPHNITASPPYRSLLRRRPVQTAVALPHSSLLRRLPIQEEHRAV